MKKRFRKGLGLSLAVLAGLAMVGCKDKKETTSTPEPTGPSETLKYSITFNVKGHGTTPSKVENVTSIPTELPTLTEAGWTFLGWYTDETLNNKVVAGATISANTTLYAKWEAAQKYSITYEVKGHGTAPSAVSNVDKLPTELPTLTEEGWVFEGWYTDEALTTQAVAGASITKNTTLYAKWTEKSMYDTLVSKEGLVIKDDFNSYTADDKLKKFEQWGTKGVYQFINEKNGVADETQNNITVGNGIAQTVDLGNNGTQLMVDFGKTLDNGTIELYTELKTTNVGTGWTFFQLYGSSSQKNNSEVFGIRNERDGLKYRIDGTLKDKIADIVQTGDELKIYLNINLETGKLNLKINGTNVLTDLEVSISSLIGFKVVSSDNSSATMDIDNIAVVNTEISVSEYGQKCINQFNAIYDSLDVDNNYTQNKDTLVQIKSMVAAVFSELKYTDLDDEIEITLSTIDDVRMMWNGVLESLESIKSDEELAFENAIQEKIAELRVYKDFSNYQINQVEFNDVLNSAIEAISKAKTADELESLLATAKAALDEIKTDDVMIAARKGEVTTEINEYLDMSIYTINKAQVEEIISTFTLNLESAMEMFEIENLVIGTKTALDSVKDDATVVQEAREVVYTNITGIADYETDFNKDEHLDLVYKATEIKEIDVTDEDKNKIFEQIIELFGNIKERLGQETELAKVNALEATIKAEIDNLITSTQLSVDDAKTAAKASIAEYIATFEGNDIYADEFTTLIDAATSVPEVNALKDEAINYVNIVAYVYDMIAEVATSYADIPDGYSEEFKTILAGVAHDLNEMSDLLNSAIVKEEDSSDTLPKYDLTTSKDNADVIKALYETKKTNLIAIYDYAKVQYEGIKGASDAATTAKDAIKASLPIETVEAISAATSVDDLDTILNNYKASIDDIIDTLIATEFTVTLKDQTDSTLTVTYGQTPVLPEQSAKDAVFVGWFTDNECSEAYTNGPLYDNLILYALWHDASIEGTGITESGFVNPKESGSYSDSILDMSSFASSFESGRSIKGLDRDGNEVIYTDFLKTGGATGSDKRYFKITLDKAATVFVAFRTGSKNASRSSFISTKATKTVDQTYGYATSSSQDEVTTYTATLTAGTWYINCDNNIQYCALQITAGTPKVVTEYTSITATDVKTEYKVGETLDLTGLALNIKDSEDTIALTDDSVKDNVHKTVMLNGEIVTSFETAGKYTVIIQYGKYTKYSYNVTVTATEE